uniref:Uncharacterized protein n=1 Tax=Cajanus cajan TaxID=3821 RepID=A0A151TVC1_CAJCA|nr:hypothetical protein KK1_010262 [Cajanus cajan]
MSRCFPFPPPGYGARGEALIESIKFRMEMEKAKKDRKEKKEKKREKKERRKEKKEKKLKEGTSTFHGTSHGSDSKKVKLIKGTTTSHVNDGGKKFKLINEIKETKADTKLQKGEDCENELIERSGITEELEQPVTSVEPCCWSDSTQSSKRKRNSLQSTHDHGLPIKIRLPLRKHREPEESKPISKFNVGSSGSVGIADPLVKTALVSDRQSQRPMITEPKRPMNTVPKRVLGNSVNSRSKVLPNLVHGDAVTTKTTLGSDRHDSQSHLLKNTQSKRVLGNSDSRHGNLMQNLVHRDAVVAKNTLGRDRQVQRLTDAEMQQLTITESKRALGNSDPRHGKPVQNSVHRATVAKNTLRDPQVQQPSITEVQQLTNTEAKRALGNAVPRHGKAVQNSVNRDAVVARNTLGSDRQVQQPTTTEVKQPPTTEVQPVAITEPKRAVGNSDPRHGKAVPNSVQRDAVAAKNTHGSDRQLHCLVKSEPKQVIGKSDSRHGKAKQNLVPVDAALVTKTAVDDEMEKVASLFKCLLQIPPIACDGLDPVDEDWLFSSEPKEARPVSKKQKTDSETYVLPFSNTPWPPRAQNLPEIEIYALPYAVPF